MQRFAYGVSAICTLLLYRNYFVDAGLFRAGLAGLGQLVAALAIGGGLAAVVEDGARKARAQGASPSVAWTRSKAK